MWEFLARSLEASTIFTFAGLGELIGQRSGILNVGIEGVMLFGATLGFMAAQTTESYAIGFLVAIAIGALLGLLHGFFSITLGGDQVVSGMGIWILGFGLTTYIGSPYTGPLGLPRIWSFAILLSRTRACGRHLVRALQDEPGAEDKIGGGESIGRRSLGDKRCENSLSLYSSRRNVHGSCRCDILPRLQPSLELQLSHGLGIHCFGPGLFLHVEPGDPARRFSALWNNVAALAQSATRTPGSPVQVHLENGSLYHHPWGLVADVNKVVQDQVGRGQARSAGRAIRKRMTARLWRITSPTTVEKP